MDDFERRELNAAIVAHCEWLEDRGILFFVKPDELETPHIVSTSERRVYSFPKGGFYRLVLAETRMQRRHRRRRPWKTSTQLRLGELKRRSKEVPRDLTRVVLDSLRRLCALRTRDRLGDLRELRRKNLEARLR